MEMFVTFFIQRKTEQKANLPQIVNKNMKLENATIKHGWKLCQLLLDIVSYLDLLLSYLLILQEAFNVLNRYEVTIEREITEQVDNLRYTWSQLLATALKVQVNLLNMQPQFQEDLKNNLEKFRQDKLDYCNEYRTAGPMQTGLTPREASDRLILFQVGIDVMDFTCV